MYYDIRQIRIILIVVGLIILVMALAAFGVRHGSGVSASVLAGPIFS